jgi:hypothetical protein
VSSEGPGRLQELRGELGVEQLDIARKCYERSGRDEDLCTSRAIRASGTSRGGPGLASQLLMFTLQGVPDDVVHLQAHCGCGDRRGVGAPEADAQPAQVHTAVADVGAEVERCHI